jgi:hypothetical protein
MDSLIICELVTISGNIVPMNSLDTGSGNIVPMNSLDTGSGNIVPMNSLDTGSGNIVLMNSLDTGSVNIVLSMDSLDTGCRGIDPLDDDSKTLNLLVSNFILVTDSVSKELVASSVSKGSSLPVPYQRNLLYHTFL